MAWLTFRIAMAGRRWRSSALRWGLVAAMCAPCAGALAAGPVESYRLAAGDAVRVVIFQNPDMTLETRVAENGRINYPLVGAIEVGGLEIGDAEAKIARALADGGFLKKPQVNISVLTIRGNKVSVLGQVNRPGAYPLETTNVRLSQMLAEAGGIAQNGADQVIISGARGGQPFRQEVDVDSIYRADRSQQDIVVNGGDTVYVPRAPMFYIYGEVQRPGNYRVDRQMTARQAIAAGGGLTARGTERRLRVVRRNDQGVPERITIELNDLVKPDDVIYVNESIF